MDYTKGLPPKYLECEWLILKLINGEIIIGKKLPELYSYDYTTADETYYKKEMIDSYMQLPTTQFKTPFEAGLEEKIAALEEKLEIAIKALEEINVSDSAMDGKWVTAYELRNIARRAITQLRKEREAES